MSTSHHPSTSSTAFVNAGLGLAFLAGLAVTAYMIADSWGPRYALFNSIIGVTVCALALLRGPGRTWPPVAGLLVTGGAVMVSRLADLTQEPGPVTALAQSVLVGSAVRHLDAPRAAAIAAGGPAMAIGTGLPGFTAVTTIAALGWLAAVAVGAILRGAGSRSGAPATNLEPTPADRPGPTRP